MPWCPKCGYEYKEGYTMCSDCKVELVESLDDIKPSEEECESEACVDEAFMEEISNMSEEELAELANEVQKSVGKNAEVYVECKTRAGEYRTGAYTLLIVGIVGAIALILFDAGVLNIAFGSSKILISVVMGLLFLVFIIMGITSYGSYKRLKVEAEKEEKTIHDIMEYFEKNVSENDIQIDESSDISYEESCLRQYESIKGIITENFGELDQAFLDFITEKIYDIMFD